jgi:NhaP-type Na+/H+ or K+/H+ antiporter
VGAFTLGAAGVVSGPIIASAEAGDRWDIPQTTALTAAGGIALGGAIGGALGWVLAREEWQEFQPPAEARITLNPDGGTALTFSLHTR